MERRTSADSNEKLARIGEATPEEKGIIKNQEKLNSLLTQFYKGFLDTGD